MNKFFHQLAMWTIFVGAVILLYLSFGWFVQKNLIMGTGMFLMGVIALANFYLHRKAMLIKRKGDK